MLIREDPKGLFRSIHSVLAKNVTRSRFEFLATRAKWYETNRNTARMVSVVSESYSIIGGHDFSEKCQS